MLEAGQGKAELHGYQKHERQPKLPLRLADNVGLRGQQRSQPEGLSDLELR